MVLLGMNWRMVRVNSRKCGLIVEVYLRFYLLYINIFIVLEEVRDINIYLKFLRRLLDDME